MKFWKYNGDYYQYNLENKKFKSLPGMVINIKHDCLFTKEDEQGEYCSKLEIKLRGLYDYIDSELSSDGSNK